MHLVQAIALAAGIYAASGQHDHWGYDGAQGPENWAHIKVAGVNQCGLQKQSPIDINVLKVSHDSSLKPLDITEDNVNFPNVSIVNNGHSVTLNAPWKQMVRGGPLNGDYRLIQMHFHWGKDSYRGSEHTVNGKRYPIELHMVHSHVSNASNKVDYPGALAVIGVFFDVTRGNSNVEINKIAKAIRDQEAGTTVSMLGDFSTRNLLPSDRSFFTYDGSLTTPPCSEVVTWLVLRDPLKITEEDLNAFRSTLFESKQAMVDNFRPVQPLHSRKVRSSFVVYSSGVMQSGCQLLVLALALFLLKNKMH